MSNGNFPWKGLTLFIRILHLQVIHVCWEIPSHEFDHCQKKNWFRVGACSHLVQSPSERLLRVDHIALPVESHSRYLYTHPHHTTIGPQQQSRSYSCEQPLPVPLSLALLHALSSQRDKRCHWRLSRSHGGDPSGEQSQLRS